MLVVFAGVSGGIGGFFSLLESWNSLNLPGKNSLES